MSRFTSFLSPQIESFIAYRKASGRWSETSYGTYLLLFDRYCKGRYPDATALSQEMVDGWCAKRDTETNNSCRSRIYSVVSLVRYLRVRKETGVFEPAIPRKEKSTYIPHAFTEGELAHFFSACDSLPDTPRTLEQRTRKITVPVFFRLLYSSGIRTTEARILKTGDVDLESGVIDVRYSKGHAQHFIVLHDSMLELMRRYDKAITALCPDRTYFFPARCDKCHTKSWVSVNFKKLWGQYNSSRAVAYELRHHYAISNIDQWVDEGFDFDDKLLYLSKSMGHAVLKSTTYYYSLTPAIAAILEDKTSRDFEWIVPEVDYGKSE
jgi:integrase